jgi:hypothetical protein
MLKSSKIHFDEKRNIQPYFKCWLDANYLVNFDTNILRVDYNHFNTDNFKIFFAINGDLSVLYPYCSFVLGSWFYDIDWNPNQFDYHGAPNIMVVVKLDDNNILYKQLRFEETP